MATRKKVKKITEAKGPSKHSDKARKAEAFNLAEEAIAIEARKLIYPGYRLFLGTGKIEPILAGHLKDSLEPVVVTPSLDVANVLRLNESIKTVLLGGLIQPDGRAVTGMLTEKGIESFTADIALQGVDGVGIDGSLYVNDPEIARINQKLAANAKQSYILVHSCDIGRTALVCCGSLDGAGTLITDDGIDPEHLKELQHIGVEVIIAAT